MNRFFQGLVITAFVFSTVFAAHAADRVVVIPLGKATTKVAGTDKQIQFNDNGTQAGAANVYYDKATGYVGIGTSTPADNLAIVNESGNAGMFVGSATGAYINMESNGSNRISMLSANDDNTNTKYPFLVAMKARGTYGAYEPVLPGDKLFGVFAKGQGSTGATPDLPTLPSAGMLFWAAEDWSNAPAGEPGGSYISFFTTANTTGNANRAARMRIDHNGNVGIGTATPASTLQVNGYVQLALTTGTPPLTDCDEATERGRMLIDNVNGQIWICVDSGWSSK